MSPTPYRNRGQQVSRAWRWASFPKGGSPGLLQPHLTIKKRLVRDYLDRSSILWLSFYNGSNICVL